MSDKYIGLMSGTSLDAIDAVLVEFDGNQCHQLDALSIPLSSPLKEQLEALTLSGNHEIERLALAEPEFARTSANAVMQLLSKSGLSADEIVAIGSHGQTLRHRPEKGYTLQIGDPSLIAELTGITVVADFRRRDVAAGGQGAPLVPAFHKALFASHLEDRVILNVGGMANITLLPADDQIVTGFDTGPGNILMDHWTHLHLAKPYDNDGRWAASGALHEGLLSECLQDSYFKLPPPKSTGRELFNLEWLEERLKPFPNLAPENVAATLCRLTAQSVANDILKHAPATQSVYVCGGGARNATLMTALQSALKDMSVLTTKEIGIAPDWVEAIAFAWLAKQTLATKPGNLPAVTGARGERILGGIYPV